MELYSISVKKDSKELNEYLDSKLNYKKHALNFIKRTSTIGFAFTAHHEVTLNTDEKTPQPVRHGTSIETCLF